MALSLAQLRAFEAVARTGSVTRAAGVLAVSPAAVSLQLRTLERDAGVRLFDRVRRRPRLTAAGETLQQYARRLFALLDEAEQSLGLLREAGGGRLRVVTSSTPAIACLPRWLAVLRRRVPGATVRVSIGNTPYVVQRLLGFDADVGIVGNDPEHAELVLVPLVRDPLVVVVPRGHRWARRPSVAIRELADEPLILREPGSGSRQLIERTLTAAKVVPRVAMEIAANDVVLHTVQAGGGIAIMSRAFVNAHAARGALALIRIRDADLVRQLYAAYHRERGDLPLTRLFLEIAKDRRQGGTTNAGARRR